MKVSISRVHMDRFTFRNPKSDFNTVTAVFETTDATPVIWVFLSDLPD